MPHNLAEGIQSRHLLREAKFFERSNGQHELDTELGGAN
ncbi:hypothetical protein L810_7319 [Burkholderia sp. AU4i]|nr:hypothetical protein L810_7319 [Burkholderia sp. AU4i]